MDILNLACIAVHTHTHKYTKLNAFKALKGILLCLPKVGYIYKTP